MTTPRQHGDASKLLNRGCERLRTERQGIGDNTLRSSVSMVEELPPPKFTPAERNQIADFFVSGRRQAGVQNRLTRFWTTERSALGASAEFWLAVDQGQST